jgi:hypothetical protein
MLASGEADLDSTAHRQACLYINAIFADRVDRENNLGHVRASGNELMNLLGVVCRQRICVWPHHSSRARCESQADHKQSKVLHRPNEIEISHGRVVASTLVLQRNRAVGFIDWLDLFGES